MRPRVLAGLALGLVVLLAALAVPTGSPPGAPEADADRPLLSGVEPGEIRALAIVDGATRVRFVRAPDGRWSDPALAPLADATVATLLSARRGRTLHRTEDAEAYGLGPLAVRVDVTTGEGTTTLRFGDVAPTGDAVYVRDDRDGPRTIFLVPRVVRARLALALDRRVSR